MLRRHLPGAHAAGENPSGTVAGFPLGLTHQLFKLFTPVCVPGAAGKEPA